MQTRHYCFGCFLLFCVIAEMSAVRAEGESSTVLRVMCYNIHHGRGTDNVFDLTRTANVIKTWNPDLVAVQEVDRNTERTNKTDQPKILADQLGMHYVFGKSIDHQGGNYGLLILSRFPILEHQMVLLPQEGQREQRGLLIAKIGIPNADGKIIRLANTHLGLSQSERESQVDKVMTLLADGSEPVLLAGDFNARPESDVLVRLLSAWKDTAVQNLDTLDKNVTPDRLRRIDYIFFRTNDPFKVLESGTIDDSITSDHKPIFSVLSF